MTLRSPMLGSRMSYSANTPEPAQPPPFTLHMPNTAVVQAWLAGAINLITAVEFKVHLQVEGGPHPCGGIKTLLDASGLQ